MILAGMGQRDANLRLASTWCMLELSTGLVPAYVTEVIGRELSAAAGYVDLHDVRARAIVFNNGQRVPEATYTPLSVLCTPPALGYFYSSTEGWLYLARVPERQTRAGMPNGSITIQKLGQRDTSCLADFSGPVAAELVQQAYCGRAPSPNLLVDDVLHLDGALYGPAWLRLGAIREEAGEYIVNTEHPMTVQKLLGGLFT